MKVIGIDPSSSCCGVALVEHDHRKHVAPKLIWTKTWKPEKHHSPPQRLFEYFEWLCDALMDDDIDPEFGYVGQSPVADLACVEFLSVMQNANSTRLISHYQAASVLACKSVGITVVEARVSSARKAALGRSGSKEEAWEEIRKLFKDHKFKSKTSGGYDEADAAVLGIAGPTMAER